MAGISSKALVLGVPQNKRKWNAGSEIESHEFIEISGLDLYSTLFRNIEPQIGRFIQLDPKPTFNISSYASMGNNPISSMDPLGDTLVSQADKEFHNRIQTTLKNKKSELQSEISQLKDQLNTDGISKSLSRNLEKKLKVLNQRVSSLNKSLYDMKLMENDPAHGYTYNQKPETESWGYTTVNRTTGIITLNTNIGLSAHEIKHASSFAKGLNHVVKEGNGFVSKNTSLVNKFNIEINAYKAHFGLWGQERMLRSPLYGQPSNFDDINLNYLRSLKDSGGLAYPEYLNLKF